jgi:hypothetical protein
MAHIRIESHQPVAMDVKVFYVPDEGDEVDISSCIQAAGVRLELGEPLRQ